MNPRLPYSNRSGSLNDPDAPEPETDEQTEARELAESRWVEQGIDEMRGDS